MKEPHYQVEHLVECSIIYWNCIHNDSIIHAYFQVKILTAIEIHNMIKWFMKRNQNQVDDIMSGVWTQTLTERAPPLKQYPVPHQQQKEWINICWVDFNQLNKTEPWLLSPSFFYFFTYSRNGGHEVRSTNYCIVCRIIKYNKILFCIAFIFTTYGQPWTENPMPLYLYFKK